jgi:hypothetical protein
LEEAGLSEAETDLVLKTRRGETIKMINSLLRIMKALVTLGI